MKKIIYKNIEMVLISNIFIVSLLIFQSINISAQTLNSPQNNLTPQQIKAQIYLFDKALNEFGAVSPEQALDIYVNGFKKRNGVMQYSVLCDNLKKDWIKRMGDPTTSYWIIGGSSPWLGDYTVLKSKRTNSLYEVTIKLHWVASGNYNEYEEKTLTIVNDNKKWCIKAIK